MKAIRLVMTWVFFLMILGTAYAEAPSIIGTWKRADGHSVIFTQKGDGTIQGAVGELGPIGAAGFSEGEVTFKLKLTADPNVFKGEIMWRSPGNPKPWWEAQTMTVSGNTLHGAGTWERQDVADEVLASEEVQQAKKEAGKASVATKEANSDVKASEEVQQAKTAITSLYDELMASLFGVETAKATSPADGIPIPQIECTPVKVDSKDGYGFIGVQDEYFAGEELYAGFNSPQGEVRIDFVKRGEQEMLLASQKAAGSNEGLVAFGALDLPGCYEVRLHESPDKDAPILAKVGFKVIPDEDTPVPGLFLNRTVFAPDEFIPVEVVIGTADPSEAWVSLVPADTKHLPAWEISRMDLREAYVSQKKNGVVEMWAPVQNGKYSMRLFSSKRGDAVELGSVDFEVKDVQWTGKPQIALDSDKYEAGKPIPVVFNAMPEWSPKAWIGLVPASTPHGNSHDNDKHDLQYVRLMQRKTGFWTVLAPKKPGKYELRMIDGNGDSSKEQAVAAFEAILPADQANKKPSLELSFDQVMPYDVLLVSYQARMDWAPDAWFGIVPVNAPKGSSEAFKASLVNRKLKNAAEGATDFGIPNKPGKYEVRMYDGMEKGSSLVVVEPLEIMSQPGIEAMRREAGENLDEFLDELAESDDVDIDMDTFKRLFGVPTITPPAEGLDQVSQYSAEEIGQLRAMLFKMANYYYPDKPIYTTANICSGVNDASQIQTVALNNSKACAKGLDEEIDLMRKIDVTLGRENKLKGALFNFALSFASKFPLAENGAPEKIQSLFNMSYDSINHGIAGVDAYNKGDYMEAVSQSMTVIMKGLVNSCPNEECFDAVRETMDQMFAAHIKKLKPNQYKFFMEKMRHALGDGDKTVNRVALMRNAMDKGMSVDVGKEASRGVDLGKKGLKEAAGVVGWKVFPNASWTKEDTAALVWTVGSTVVSSNPVGAIVLATGEAGYESMRAARDMIVDGNTQKLYRAYKEAYAGGAAEADAVFAGTGAKNLPSLVKARQFMAKNPSHPLVRRALTEDNRSKTRTAKKINPDMFSQDEVLGFLKNQFAAWVQDEKKGNKLADYANRIRSDFEDLQCRGAFEQYRDRLKGKSTMGRAWDYYENWKTDNCARERDSFQAYVKLRNDISAKIAGWAGTGSTCLRDVQEAQSKALACRLVSQGEEAYLDLAAKFAIDCKWKMGDPKLKKAVRTRKHRIWQMKIVKGLEKIGRPDVANCLCARSAGVVNASYHPQPTKGRSPSCDSSSGGPCIGGSYGCLRHNIRSTDSQGNSNIEACGVRAAVKEWKQKNKK